jgi:thymidylate synthase (FAD)
MAYQTRFSVHLIASTHVDYDELRDLMGTLSEVEDLSTWVNTRDHTDDSELLIEFAGKSCYMSFSTDLNKNLTRVNFRSNKEYIQNSIIGHGHTSVLEHSTVSIFIKDVSRVVTHELVRHRPGNAFSQESGRYVRRKEIGYYIPPVIANSEQADEAIKIFQEAFEVQEAAVAKLEKLYDIDNKDFHTKKLLTSAFRRILGDGRVNNILLTSNHRILRHMIELRTSLSAEEEIREVFHEIFLLVFRKMPHIYADAKVLYHNGNPIPEVKFTKA